MKLSVIFLSVAAFAAEITGTWIAQVPSRQGQPRVYTFKFKAEGDKLTGTMDSRSEAEPIKEGRINGDTITFVRDTQRGKQTFTGKVTGAEIKFKRTREKEEPIEFVATRKQ